MAVTCRSLGLRATGPVWQEWGAGALWGCPVAQGQGLGLSPCYCHCRGSSQKGKAASTGKAR